jgi:hypothetical protein
MKNDRRDFLRTGAFALAAAVLEACNSRGPKSALPLLDFAEKKNEGVERFLFRHTSMDHASARRFGFPLVLRVRAHTDVG